MTNPSTTVTTQRSEGLAPNATVDECREAYYLLTGNDLRIRPDRGGFYVSVWTAPAILQHTKPVPLHPEAGSIFSKSLCPNMPRDHVPMFSLPQIVDALNETAKKISTQERNALKEIAAVQRGVRVSGFVFGHQV